MISESEIISTAEKRVRNNRPNRKTKLETLDSVEKNKNEILSNASSRKKKVKIIHLKGEEMQISMRRKSYFH